MAEPDEPRGDPSNYAQPGGRGARGNRGQFWGGLIGGSVGSLIFWSIFMFAAGGSKPGVAIFAFLIAKVVVGLALSLSSRWRAAGSGVFLSLGVGTLIFLGTCGIAVAHWLN